jgi:hypothetical protein
MTKYIRKIDTRNKIELGGLVIKSKLSYLQEHNKDVILGCLIDAYNKIQSSEGDHHLSYYKLLGEKAFNDDIIKSFVKTKQIKSDDKSDDR